ncbi:MAG: BON domain-containing protein [Rhodospirillaceae bacterium]|nr:BON domain-containing protein [Rhodospirillaceae bacterium]
MIGHGNLVQALAALKPTLAAASDSAIREQLIAELDRNLSGAGRNNIVVKDGVVDLWGYAFSDHEREAIQVAAENIPGVKEVRNHLAWIEPLTGMILDSPPENGPSQTAGAPMH